MAASARDFKYAGRMDATGEAEGASSFTSPSEVHADLDVHPGVPTWRILIGLQARMQDGADSNAFDPKNGSATCDDFCLSFHSNECPAATIPRMPQPQGQAEGCSDR